MNLYAWIKRYEKKTGNKFNPFPSAQIEFDEVNGFCTWEKDGDILYVSDTCGNGRYWEKFLDQKAKELNCKSIKFATTRQPTIFTRKYGYKIVGYVLEKEVH